MLKTKLSTPQIYDDLHMQLVTAQIPQGQKMRSERLREDYDCSANTIREVLFRLASEGLVIFEDQRGFRARPADPERLHYLAKFRIMLEQEGATASILNGGLEWEAQLAAAHHKLSHIESEVRRAGGVEHVLSLWSNAEWEFHDTLISASRSPLLRETYKIIYDQFRQQLVSRDSNYGYYADNIEEHRAILEAALARDEPLCRQHIHDHLARNMIGKS